MDSAGMLTGDNIERIAAKAMELAKDEGSRIVDTWEIGTDVWLVRVRDGADRPIVATAMVGFSGGYSVAWYDMAGHPRFAHLSGDDL